MDKQTDRQADRQTDRHTNRQTDRKTQRDKQTDRQIYRQNMAITSRVTINTDRQVSKVDIKKISLIWIVIQTERQNDGH